MTKEVKVAIMVGAIAVALILIVVLSAITELPHLTR